MGWFSSSNQNKPTSANVSDDNLTSLNSSAASATPSSPRARRTKSVNGHTDPDLLQKKRARRRLIGAVALVLAAIIGLPMLLDSEPKPLANDVEIQIPSKDQSFSPSAVAPANSLQRKNNPAAPEPPVETVIDSKPQATDLDASSNPPSTAVAGSTEPDLKPIKPPQATTRATDNFPVKAAPAVKPVDKTEPGKSATPSVNSEKNQDAQRAQTILEGGTMRAAAQPANPKAGKFVIQVAALASKEKVSELQQKLTSAGVHSYTQKVATEAGERIRIRIGPFADKAEADATRAKVLKLGLNGTLVPVNP